MLRYVPDDGYTWENRPPGKPPTELAFIDVVGNCPECGHSLLCLDYNGVIRCRNAQCPDNTATTKILAIADPRHYVKLGTHSYHIQHPLRERKTNDLLFKCPLDIHLERLVNPPAKPGYYHVALGETGWVWERDR